MIVKIWTALTQALTGMLCASGPIKVVHSVWTKYRTHINIFQIYILVTLHNNFHYKDITKPVLTTNSSLLNNNSKKYYLQISTNVYESDCL